jgi:hypothetical protein
MKITPYNQIVKLIPSSWNEITVDHYQFILESKFEDDDGFFSKKIKALEILCGLDDDDSLIEELNIQELKTLINKISFLNTLPQKVNHSIDGYILIKFDKIKVGQYIDIEFWIQNIDENLHKIISALYLKTKVDEWGNVEYEPYKFDIDIRSQEFSDKSMGLVYGAVHQYLLWREGFIENNKSIFTKEEANDDDDEYTKYLSSEEIEDLKKDEEKEKTKQKYAWPYFLYQLVDGDLLKMKEMFDLNMLYVINMFKMRKLFEN